jgi:hypothetical protein
VGARLNSERRRGASQNTSNKRMQQRPRSKSRIKQEIPLAAPLMRSVRPLTRAEDEQMELKIKVICEELPDTAFLGSPSGAAVARRDFYLGIQRGNDIIEAVPANQKRVVFEPNFRVLPLPEDKTNFLGPFAKGTPTQRYFYLSWAVKGAGGELTMFGRVKVHLSHLRWSEVEETLRTGKPLTVKLRLTDKRGRPRCGSIRGEDVSWQG